MNNTVLSKRDAQLKYRTFGNDIEPNNQAFVRKKINVICYHTLLPNNQSLSDEVLENASLQCTNYSAAKDQELCNEEGSCEVFVIIRNHL